MDFYSYYIPGNNALFLSHIIPNGVIASLVSHQSFIIILLLVTYGIFLLKRQCLCPEPQISFSLRQEHLQMRDAQDLIVNDLCVLRAKWKSGHLPTLTLFH